MQKSGAQSQRGSLLLTAVIYLTLLAIVMIPVVQYINMSTRMASGTRASDQAFYAAEAGVARMLSFIYSKGSGHVTGIHDASFDVDEANAYYPFGTDWATLDEGINTNNSARVGVCVRIWKDTAPGVWKIESTGRAQVPKNIYRKITASISASSFARYVFFNDDSLSTIDGRPRWLGGGEIFNGPVHSNRHLFVGLNATDANPLVFNSDVTIVGDEVKYNSSSVIEYNGLKDTNATYIALPSNLTELKHAAANGGINLPNDDPWTPPAGYVDPVPGINNYKIVFNNDGTVTYTNLDAKTWSMAHGVAYTPQTVTLANTNGALVVNNGNAFVSGTVNGRATVAAMANHGNPTPIGPFSSTRTDGNVIIDGNIVYNTHPQAAGQPVIGESGNLEGATDVLGIIAERNLSLDGSAPANCIVDAHLLVTGQATPNPDVRTWPATTDPGTVIGQAINQDGAFFTEDGSQRDLSELWTGVPDSDPGTGNQVGSGWKLGNLYLNGGVVHFLRGQTAIYGVAGYSRHYNFDTRLLTNSPPFYPLTPDLEVVGWDDVASTD